MICVINECKNMNVTIFTLFPELYPGPLGISVAKMAMQKGVLKLNIVNIRDFGVGRHKKIDEKPYGGGPGLLLRPDVLSDAIEFAKKGANNPKIVTMSARGVFLTQGFAVSFLEQNDFKNRDLFVICPRFEGLDFRLVEFYNILEISLGKFVILGGDCAAFVFLECIIRLLDGVLHNSNSIVDESYSPQTEYENLVEHPQYTQPESWNLLEVPKILTSGHHQKIHKWRIEKAVSLTEYYSNLKDFK